MYTCIHAGLLGSNKRDGYFTRVVCSFTLRVPLRDEPVLSDYNLIDMDGAKYIK